MAWLGLACLGLYEELKAWLAEDLDGKSNNLPSEQLRQCVLHQHMVEKNAQTNKRLGNGRTATALAPDRKAVLDRVYTGNLLAQRQFQQMTFQDKELVLVEHVRGLSADQQQVDSAI